MKCYNQALNKLHTIFPIGRRSLLNIQCKPIPLYNKFLDIPILIKPEPLNTIKSNGITSIKVFQ